MLVIPSGAGQRLGYGRPHQAGDVSHMTLQDQERQTADNADRQTMGPIIGALVGVAVIFGTLLAIAWLGGMSP